jgi:hypothetical protein
MVGPSLIIFGPPKAENRKNIRNRGICWPSNWPKETAPDSMTPKLAGTARADRARARSCTTRSRPRESNHPPPAPSDGSVASDPLVVVKSHVDLRPQWLGLMGSWTLIAEDSDPDEQTRIGSNDSDHDSDLNLPDSERASDLFGYWHVQLTRVGPGAWQTRIEPC